MPDRKIIKARAKAALEENYWKSVFVCIILLVLSWGTVYASMQDSITHFPELMQDIANGMGATDRQVNLQAVAVLITLVGGILIVSIIGKLVVGILIENPVQIGADYFMVKTNLEVGGGEIADLAYSFDHHYLLAVKTMLVRVIVTALWSILLVVPGLIKMYEYRLVPYLITEMPNASQKEILQRSREYMNGNKLEALKLDLSFIPWILLGVLTLGFLDILYIKPYKQLANAAFYLAVKEMNEQNEAK